MNKGETGKKKLRSPCGFPVAEISSTRGSSPTFLVVVYIFLEEERTSLKTFWKNPPTTELCVPKELKNFFFNALVSK